MGVWLERAKAAQGENIHPPTKPTKLTKPIKMKDSGGFGGFDSFDRGAIFRESHLTDFAERVAVLIEAGGHSPEDAHRLAMEEIGGETLSMWRYHIERLPTATGLEATQLVQTATAFLDSPLGAMAAYHGWDDWKVFGVFNGPPRATVRRHDAMGLVPALAWSRIGSQLVDIDRDRAIIKTRSDSTLTLKRTLTGRRFAVPVWWSKLAIKK